MVSQAKNAGIKVYILTATVIYEDPAHDLNKKLVPYNNALRDIAAEQGCALVDVSATMIVALEKLREKYPDIKGNLLTVDGVHMNPLGDIFMAVTLLKSFGFSDQEIAEAGKNWQDLGMDYDGIRIRNRYMHNLLQLANKNKCSLYEIVNRVLHKALAE